MGKFDVSHFKYLSKAQFRILTSIEMGMKNHEHVPELLVFAISGLNKRLCIQVLKDLVKLKLARYLRNKDHNGYSLTFFGYDILSLRALSLQKAVTEIGSKVGVGKESDVYIGRNENGERIILKFHRLGRNSFRKVIDKRDYLCHRQYASWLYLSRLAATREYQFMTALKQNGFSVPQPLAHNRHCVVMSLIDGFPLNQINCLEEPADQYTFCRDMLVKLAEHGLIHCDFNEFNLIVDENGDVYMIDFPQMVSIDHQNADYYFQRDFKCIKLFFEKRFKFRVEDTLMLSDIGRTANIDRQVSASGRDNTTCQAQDDFSDPDHLSDASETTSTCELDLIGASLAEIDIGDSVSQSETPISPSTFSADYIRNRVNQLLSKKELNIQWSTAVKNSKRAHNNYKSRHVTGDIHLDS